MFVYTQITGLIFQLAPRAFLQTWTAAMYIELETSVYSMTRYDVYANETREWRVNNVFLIFGRL